MASPLNVREFEQTPGDSGGHRSWACCSLRGCKESGKTWRLNNNKYFMSKTIRQGGDICVYLWLIHAEAWQTITKFCKAIILQLKKNLLKWFTGREWQHVFPSRRWICWNPLKPQTTHLPFVNASLLQLGVTGHSWLGHTSGPQGIRCLEILGLLHESSPVFSQSPPSGVPSPYYSV